MRVCENGLIVKLLSKLDAAGLPEQFGVSRFAGFYSHTACYFKKGSKNGRAVKALFL